MRYRVLALLLASLSTSALADFPPPLPPGGAPPPPIPDFGSSPYWPWKNPDGQPYLPASNPTYYYPVNGGCNLQIHQDFGTWDNQDPCSTIPTKKGCVWPDGNTLPQSLMGVMFKELELGENAYLCFKDSTPALNWTSQENPPGVEPRTIPRPPDFSEGYEEICANMAKAVLCRWYFNHSFLRDNGGGKGGFACEDPRSIVNDPGATKLVPIRDRDGNVIACGESRKAMCRRRTESCVANALLNFQRQAGQGYQAAARYCGTDFYWAHEGVKRDPRGEWVPVKEISEGSPMHHHRKAQRRMICHRGNGKGLICYFATLAEMGRNKHPIENSCWKEWREQNPRSPLPDIDGNFNTLVIDLPDGEEGPR